MINYKEYRKNPLKLNIHKKFSIPHIVHFWICITNTLLLVRYGSFIPKSWQILVWVPISISVIKLFKMSLELHWKLNIFFINYGRAYSRDYSFISLYRYCNVGLLCTDFIIFQNLNYFRIFFFLTSTFPTFSVMFSY